MGRENSVCSHMIRAMLATSLADESECLSFFVPRGRSSASTTFDDNVYVAVYVVRSLLGEP